MALTPEARNWREYWNSAPLVHDDDLMRQVGKTVHGQPFTEEQVNAIVREIVDALDVNRADTVIDLGCGNGVVTRGVARSCRRISGVDFSAPLLASANSNSAGSNIRYVYGDIRSLPAEVLTTLATKIYLYEVLQHMDDAGLKSMLSSIGHSELGNVPIFLGSIPDRARLSAFYNTESLMAEYHRRIADGSEAIGTWWDRTTLGEIITGQGYDARFLDLDPLLDGARYRFHVLCVPVTSRSSVG